MVISNEAAMLRLSSAKQRAQEEFDGYWSCVFIGAAGAYLMAEVITLEQYNLLIAPPDQQKDAA